MDKYKAYQQILAKLKADSNLRVLPPKPEGNTIDFCSNDYLGLNSNEQLYEEFLKKIADKKHRFSASSSRLLSGNSVEYEKLESLISDLYSKEACLVFNSGYHANAGIFRALTTKNDLILADKLVHASIIDGILLSPAKFLRFKHLDYGQLEHILENESKKHDRIFIVSETIFSMDGDMADIARLVALKKKYNCFLYLDEAHAMGVRGDNGLGLSEEKGEIGNVDILLGTFGKALASIGAFVVCSEIIKKMLVNHARTLIYTTALPPVNLAWTYFVVENLPYFKNEREKLKHLVQQFSTALQLPANSHIIPYIIGENETTMQVAENMNKHGFHILPIRYPTVPKGTARLRFSLNANMEFNNIKNVLNYLPQA